MEPELACDEERRFVHVIDGVDVGLGGHESAKTCLCSGLDGEVDRFVSGRVLGHGRRSSVQQELGDVVVFLFARDHERCFFGAVGAVHESSVVYKDRDDSQRPGENVVVQRVGVHVVGQVGVEGFFDEEIREQRLVVGKDSFVCQ